jgi:phosphoribosylformylglycinamidine synthase I
VKWAVVVFPGSNCDRDAAWAIERATGDPVDLVWHKETSLDGYDAVILPGGFSYGDYLRSGAIARFSPVMQAVRRAADEGRLVLGICNGFQILTEAGLLPGALVRNTHLQFRCELCELEVANADSSFTAGYQAGETLRIPIAHGEGRYIADEKTLAALEQTGRVAFRYRQDVNGSVNRIAGVLNERGNVLGMMPHPERAVAEWMGSVDGLRLFTAMREYTLRHKAAAKGGVEVG